MAICAGLKLPQVPVRDILQALYIPLALEYLDCYELCTSSYECFARHFSYCFKVHGTTNEALVLILYEWTIPLSRLAGPSLLQCSL